MRLQELDPNGIEETAALSQDDQIVLVQRGRLGVRNMKDFLALFPNFNASLIAEAYPSSQVPWGSAGDSIANIATAPTGHDVRSITSGNFNVSASRMGGAIAMLSGGMLRPVANCGVSGETTTQMLARDAAASSATRKSITDAGILGAEQLVWSAGINDLQALAGGSSQATIDSTVNTAVENCKTLLRRARGFGMVNHFPSLLGYHDYSGVSDAQDVTRNVAILQFNAAMKAWLDANPLIGRYYDCRSIVCEDPVLGTWKSGYTQDGLHPTLWGSVAAYEPVVSGMLEASGLRRFRFAFPKSQNCFDNADYSASSNGLATRVSTNVGAGTATVANSLVEFRGALWQQHLVTPTALDASGDVQFEQRHQIPVYGGSPYVSISANDKLAAEIDLYIDDGSGGPPPVYTLGFRLRKFGATATIYSDTPAYDTSAVTGRPTEKFDQKLFTLPFVCDEASAALTDFRLSLFVYTDQTTKPLRVMTSNPRVVKLPSTY